MGMEVVQNSLPPPPSSSANSHYVILWISRSQESANNRDEPLLILYSFIGSFIYSFTHWFVQSFIQIPDSVTHLVRSFGCLLVIGVWTFHPRISLSFGSGISISSGSSGTHTRKLKQNGPVASHLETANHRRSFINWRCAGIAADFSGDASGDRLLCRRRNGLIDPFQRSTLKRHLMYQTPIGGLSETIP